MDFDRLCMIFTMQEPFYGILLQSMIRKPNKALKTLGIRKSGSCFQLDYNPDFVGKFNTDTIMGLLKHEILHVALDHFALWDTPPADKNEQFLRNLAADMEVNGYLDRNLMQKEAGGIWPEDYGFNKFEGTRWYYQAIKRMMEGNRQQKGIGSPQDKPCNGGKTNQPQQSLPNQNQSQNDNQCQPNPQNGDNPGDGQNGQGQSQPKSGNDKADEEFKSKFEPFDEHDDWPETTDGTPEAEQMRQMVDQLLDFAAIECEKNQGHIPGEMVGRIEKIRQRPRPVTDWKRYFRRYMGNEFTELIRKSKKRESRRFPDAAGNRHQRKSHILVAIDTSGSVSMPEYNEFFGQIKTLSQSATFHVVECDTRIQHEYDFNGRQNQILHGGGGTDFQPPVDMFNENRRKYDALVYFTDGYADIPKDTPKETLWVVSSEGDHDRSRYRRNGASVVFIPKKH